MHPAKLKKLLAGTAILLGVAVAGVFLAGGCMNSIAFQPSRGSQVDPATFDVPIREVTLITDDAVKLHAFYVERPGSDRVVLFLHGNAGNASHRLGHAVKMSQLGVNVFLLDYRGYGKSKGSPNEAGVYQDARSALRYIEQDLGFSKGRTILYGRSLGSAVAVDAAQNEPYAGLILVSPFTSGYDFARSKNLGWIAWVFGTRFNSAKKIPDVLCPVLFIYGDSDTVIVPALSRKLLESCVVQKKSHIVRGGGHNDLVLRAGRQYWDWLSDFFASVETEAPPLGAADSRPLDTHGL